MRVLAADVGGTHTRVATFEAAPGDRPRCLRVRRWRSGDHGGLAPLLSRFVRSSERRHEHACVAVAGPVVEGASTLSNLGWTVRRDTLAEVTGIEDLLLVNDFVAQGHGVSLLTGDERAVIHGGRQVPDAPRAVLGPGTGLGVACVDPHAGVRSSEGGHTLFAPWDEESRELARHLRAEVGRPSWEEVLSGSGMERLHAFVAAGSRDGGAADGAPDAPEITRRGLEEGDPEARGALALFVAGLGAFAATMALALGARGGVWLTGGIVPALVPLLREGPFLDRFLDQGPMGDYVAALPVWVSLNRDVGLLGAAAAALAEEAGTVVAPSCAEGRRSAPDDSTDPTRRRR